MEVYLYIIPYPYIKNDFDKFINIYLMIEFIIPITCLAITGIINSYINNNHIKTKKKEFAKKSAYINKINKNLYKKS